MTVIVQERPADVNHGSVMSPLLSSEFSARRGLFTAETESSWGDSGVIVESLRGWSGARGDASARFSIVAASTPKILAATLIAPRPGWSGKFSAEQVGQILAVGEDSSKVMLLSGLLETANLKHRQHADLQGVSSICSDGTTSEGLTSGSHSTIPAVMSYTAPSILIFPALWRVRTPSLF